LEHLSHHDFLTNLPNRRLFMLRLEHAIEHAKRDKSEIAVLFLDLDEFKQINDTLGHDIGDQLLVEVSSRLKETIRNSDTLARIGGDEFNILIEDVEDIRDIEIILEKILADFKFPFVCSGHEITTTASIGVSLYPDDGKDMLTLIKNADLAMYQSKDEGRNNYSFFSKKLSEYIEERARYINAMKADLQNRCSEFLLVYQPKISLETGKISGAEALIRWRSHELGFVRPDKFIKMAEETNMIIPLGEWILNQALSDYKAMQDRGCHYQKISVNVSSVQLLNSDMIKTVKSAIRTSDVNPKNIELEITESYIATDQKKALKTLQELRAMNLDLAIDDFGTGYSSLSYLQKLPVTRLKIDKSFVDDLPDSKKSIAIAKSIIALANTFNLSITAEGVETQEQLDYLKSVQCHEIQGYFYSKPLAYEEFINFYFDYNKNK
ncbi:MAG: EAL domain-containing protein, partial [Campylobacterota bacterium]|nr:EAL domain-containing protein [Campylobacterota bacterium]